MLGLAELVAKFANVGQPDHLVFPTGKSNSVKVQGDPSSDHPRTNVTGWNGSLRRSPPDPWNRRLSLSQDGVEAYPHAWEVDMKVADLIAQYSDLADGERSNEEPGRTSSEKGKKGAQNGPLKPVSFLGGKPCFEGKPKGKLSFWRSPQNNSPPIWAVPFWFLMNL